MSSTPLSTAPLSDALRTSTLHLAGLEVPAIEIRGAHDGPTLALIAGVHGCEYSSMAGLRRFAHGLDHQSLRGRILAVPILNLPSFWSRTPFVVPDDGKNLNRCFPGDPAGTLTERLAHDVFEQIIRSADALVDLHAGDQPEALEPFAIYDAGPAERDARQLALAYGVGYVIRQEPGPDRAVAGSSSAAAAAIGVPAIIAEAGGCGLVDRAAVRRHVDGLGGVLSALHMLPAPSSSPASPDDGVGATPPPVELDRFVWLRAGTAGWWEAAVEVGTHVLAGQLLGTITTLDGGAVIEEVRSPADGVPMFVTTSPAVADDGLLLGLGASTTPLLPA